MERPRPMQKNPLQSRLPRRSTQQVQSRLAHQPMTPMTHCSSASPISRNDEQWIVHRICAETVVNFLICSDGLKSYFFECFPQSWSLSALQPSSDDDLFAITAIKVAPGGYRRPNRSVQLRNAVNVNFNRLASHKILGINRGQDLARTNVRESSKR